MGRVITCSGLNRNNSSDCDELGFSTGKSVAYKDDPSKRIGIVKDVKSNCIIVTFDDTNISERIAKNLLVIL